MANSSRISWFFIGAVAAVAVATLLLSKDSKRQISDEIKSKIKKGTRQFTDTMQDAENEIEETRI
ncbi:MAG TPA: hypothetical protein VKR32_13475 [Puia sp.]|nr:hypothetical protein [Puia sp.]